MLTLDQQFGSEIGVLVKEIHKQREGILKAFLAEFGCLPSECIQVVQQIPGGWTWRIEKIKKIPEANHD